jgi:glycosyltransferase involved in cell wall biosynthesis
VLSPENPSFAVKDPSLEKDVPPEAEVMRLPIWEPYDLFFRIAGLFGGKKQATPTALVSSKNKSMFKSISTWIRGNFFIPDPRIFWVRPAVSFLSDYVARNKIQVIITTGPPHSIHLIGLTLKRRLPELRWLADFRDPWSEWGMWDSLMVSKLVRKVHKRLERKVLEKADEIITITPFYARRFEQLAKRPVRLLTNGYDENDFKNIAYERPPKFLIRHVGLINERCDPRPFMRALESEMRSDAIFSADVHLEFIGEVHPDFQQFVTHQPLVAAVTSFTGNVPHDELIRVYGSSSLLLLILTGYKDAEGFLPGKLFEYFATGLPVLGVGPVSGDAAVLLHETRAGVMIESNDEPGMRMALKETYTKWKNKSEPYVHRSNVKNLSRREVTARLADILQQQITKSAGQSLL